MSLYLVKIYLSLIHVKVYPLPNSHYKKNCEKLVKDPLRLGTVKMCAVHLSIFGIFTKTMSITSSKKVCHKVKAIEKIRPKLVRIVH